MTQLGKFDLLEVLGKGGFGTVYRAMDRSLEREVAIKILHPQLMVDESFIERFRKEAKVLAKLEHPNIVSIYELGEEEGRMYIAMRYLQGGSLRDRLKKAGLLSWAETLKIIQQIGDGLHVAHTQEKLVHRDIKPENILFDKQGNAVLSDFGLVKAASSSLSGSSAGMVLGTPNYVAPEIWNGEPAAPASDQYALACVVAEMLSGKKPFSGDTTPVVMKKHVLEAPSLPEKWREGVPEKLNDVLNKALSKKPQERYASIREFIQNLENQKKQPDVQLAQDVTPHTAPPIQPSFPPTRPTLPPLPKKSRSKRFWVWIGAALGFLAVTALVLFLTINALRQGTLNGNPQNNEMIVLKVGSDFAYPPYEYINDAGELIGFDIELMEMIAEEMGVEIVWVEKPFDVLFEAVQNQEVDLAIAAIGYSEERDRSMDFSIAYLENPDVFLVKKSFMGGIASPEDISTYRVGVQQDSWQDAWLEAELVSSGDMSEQLVLRFDNMEDAIADLLDGKVDIVIMERTLATRFLFLHPELVEAYQRENPNASLYIVFPPGSTQLKQSVNSAIGELQKNGQIDQLFREIFRYYP